MRTSAPLILILALPALTSCSVSAPEQPVLTPSVSTSAAPETLKVACSPTGLTLSSKKVAATAGGVRISVSSTAPAGTYVNFGWDGGGEGNAAPRRAAVWTMPTPPGDLQVSCSTLTKEWAAQSV